MLAMKERALFTKPGFVAFLSLVIVCFAAVGAAWAAPVIGADEAIARIGQMIEGGEQLSGKEESQADLLMRDIEKFRGGRSGLSSNAAADAWLKLYDRFWRLPQADLMKAKEMDILPSAGTGRLSAKTLLAALPEPEAWDALKKRVMTRASKHKGMPETVLQILVQYLTQDRKGLDKGLAELKASAGDHGRYLVSMFPKNIFTAPGTSDGKGIFDSFDSYLRSLQSDRPEGLLTVNVPDLVSLAGDKKASALILRAIAIPGLTLRVPSGEDTLRLAKRLVQENATKLIEPQWQLVTGIGDLKLYETLAKRFPDNEKKTDRTAAVFQDIHGHTSDYSSVATDEGKRRAKIFYVMGLIAAGRADDAVAKAKEMTADDVTSADFDRIWQSFEKIRYASGVDRFCSGLLSERPELPLWSQCGVAASSPETREKLVAIATAASAKQDVGPAARLRISERTVELLLAMDRTDDAIATGEHILAFDAGGESQAEQQAVAQVKRRVISKTCELSRLLNRPELMRKTADQFLAMIKGDGRGMGAGGSQYSGDGTAANSVITTLLDSGEYGRAESMVLAMIEAELHSPQVERAPRKSEMVATYGMLAGQLTRLAEIYDRANRPKDVLKLLERSPWWGAEDLMLIADANPSLSPIAARALHAAGRDGEAIDVLKERLYADAGDDDVYRVLVDLSGPSLIGWLDELYQRDRFEERPLIWKAYLLKREGKLEEAEAAARRAIKIDPTDGEEKTGDRGRAYVVLADVLKDRGKKDDAAFFERIVSSIRIAEEGDAYTKAGLLRRSLSYYEKAANAFADAYCVQWRMAERLSALGDHDGARKHYEIAFERMPEQFGRVANFCFGCEGVFTHEQSQSVAETVLTRLEKTEGQRPQVYYLLGQLRESQGRKSEAYRSFRKAAEIDPEYLDAWKAAYDLADDVFLPQEDRDKIALHIIGEDPMLRHARIDIDRVSDQKGLWKAYEKASARQVRIPDRLLELKASKEALDAFRQKYSVPEWYYAFRTGNYAAARRVLEPGETVAKNRFVQSLMSYLLSSSVGVGM